MFQPWLTILPHPNISLGLPAFDSTNGCICLYLKHIGLDMILGLGMYIFNWEKNSSPVGFVSKLMMNTGLNMLVQSVYKNHLVPPSAYRHPVALSFRCWWCCEVEILSLPLLAALLTANPLSNSQHWQIGCWSCWVGRTERRSISLLCMLRGCPGGQGGTRGTTVLQLWEGTDRALGKGGGGMPQLPLPPNKSKELNLQLQYPLYGWSER